MSTPALFTVIGENLTDEARALAPGDGRRRPAEVDAAGLHVWLGNFAGLPALDAEDAGARLHVSGSGRRFVVRRAGGRLGWEEGGNFVAASVDEIVAQLLAPPPAAVTAMDEAEPGPPAKSSVRTQAWPLLGLLAVLVAACWWSFLPETPEGVEWVGSAAERDVILAQAAGTYLSDDEQLRLDAAGGRLTATDAEGKETLRTPVRVGRRGGSVVFVTDGGVVLEVSADGHLRLDATDYRRAPTRG